MTNKAKTRLQIADEYGICAKTLSRWLKKSKISLPTRDLIPPKVLEEIYARFGCPEKSIVDE